METKMLEIRDIGTFIPVMCTAMVSDEPEEDYLLMRTGYGNDRRLIMLNWLTAKKCDYSPLNWGGRTMPTAHQYITENWDDLKSGDVIDVSFILGESDYPKRSERYGG